MANEERGLTYAQAGVDIDAGNRMVDLIKPLGARHRAAGCGRRNRRFWRRCSTLKAAGYTDPILVAANDGVGTKVKIAIETGRHDTIGIDLVAMSVNDLVVQGAEPLFFLDYYACGKLEPEIGAAVVAGIADRLPAGRLRADRRRDRGNARALSGRTITTSPALRSAPSSAATCLPRADIASGDVIIGIASSGVHSNGFSLVRKVVDQARTRPGPRPLRFAPAPVLGEAVLTPTRIYVKALPRRRSARPRR